MLEIKDGTGQVNGDGIHPDDPEKERPFLEFPNVDHQIKQGEQNQAHPTHITYERTGPQILIDRED